MNAHTPPAIAEDALLQVSQAQRSAFEASRPSLFCGNVTVADVIPLVTEAELHPFRGWPRHVAQETLAKIKLAGMAEARRAHHERRDTIALLADRPKALHRYLAGKCVLPLLTFGEAAAFWAEEARSLRVKLARPRYPYSESPEFLRPRLAEAVEHMIVARWFRRFSKQAALEQAA